MIELRKLVTIADELHVTLMAAYYLYLNVYRFEDAIENVLRKGEVLPVHVDELITKGYAMKVPDNPLGIRLNLIDIKKRFDKYIETNTNIIERVGVNEWIDDYRRLFMQVNGERGGNVQDCIDNMVYVMSKYGLEKVEIFEATKLYLKERQLDDVQYVSNAHNFLAKVTNNNDEPKSKILEYIERIRLLKSRTDV